ncbi:MAG: RHS repeat domain-containing protein [archaeon]
MKVYVNDGGGIMSQVRSVRDEANTERNKQRLYYHYDSLGSVSLITNEIGKPLQEYYYTPYGECFNVASDSINGLRFVGRYGGYTDDDTGLTYFWHRWYSSDDGRWVSRDRVELIFNTIFYNETNQYICEKSLLKTNKEKNFILYREYVYSDNNVLNRIDIYGNRYTKIPPKGTWGDERAVKIKCKLLKIKFNFYLRMIRESRPTPALCSAYAISLKNLIKYNRGWIKYCSILGYF